MSGDSDSFTVGLARRGKGTLPIEKSAISEKIAEGRVEGNSRFRQRKRESSDALPRRSRVLVVDNASYHTSATSRAALSLFEHRVLIIWLPPYCALELNPIERYWRHLKDQVCVNKLHPSLDELIAAVEAELERQNNPDNPDRFKLLKNEV